ncbi:MAG: UbiD family decarboxylase [Nitrospinota bacterium]
MAHRDLRTFLKDLEERGDLLRVDRSLNPRLEAAAVLRSLDDDEGPAVIFDRLRGRRVPVVGNLLSARRRLELALGTEENFREAVTARLGKRRKPRKAKSVPVHQVVLRKGFDLAPLLPVLTYHARDKGPFITSGVTLTRNPETDNIHLGIYRMQVQDRNLLSAQIASPPLSRFVAEAAARGDAVPVAIALGPDPGLWLGSVLQSEHGGDKLELAGGLRGGPVEIADGVTVELPVPARAELVLEGRILPGKHVEEGPMGESSGVYTKSRSCLIEITAVTHRQDFLYHALLPWSRDEEALLAVAYALPMEIRLRAHDPSIRAFHLVSGTAATHAVASIEKNRRGHARDVMTLAFGLFPIMKQLVVVDEDIDPRDPRMVSWAVATRFQGDRDLVVIPKGSGFIIDPSAHRRDGSVLSTKVGLDATMPFGDRDHYERIDVGDPARRRATEVLSRLSRNGKD